MKAIITGGAGFIGGHLVEKLKADGHEAKVVDIKLQAGGPALDVRDLARMREEFAGFDVVFHLAALVSVPYSIEHPVETHETNLTGTLNVLLAAHDAGVKRVIFSSSAAVYGDAAKLPVREDAPKLPLSPYAYQKLAGEEMLRLFSRIYGLETVSLRYFNVYGAGQDPAGPYAAAVPKFLAWHKAGEPLQIIGDGEQTRDYIHVSDVVSANLAAALSSKVGKGEAINIATGRSVSMNEIAALIGGPVEHLPPRLEIRDSLADISLARSLLDWEPKTDLEEGIKALLG